MKFLSSKVSFSLFLVAFPVLGDYSTSDADLARLQDIQSRVASAISEVQKDYDDPQVIPRERDRRFFRKAMQDLTATLSGENGVEGWIKSVTNKVPPSPEWVKKDIGGFYVVGIHEPTKNEGIASNEHNKQCEVLASEIRSLLGKSFDSFDCGSPKNVSEYKSVGYFQFASSPTVRIQIPSFIKLEEVNGNAIAGNNVTTKDPGLAYAPWRDACFKWLRKVKAENEQRFIAASCGTPQNVSQYKSVGYFEYQSMGRLYLN